MTHKYAWRAAFLCLFLFGCKTVETAQDHRDILDDYKALNVRLDRLASPLLRENVDLCARTKMDDGIRWHQLSDYPKNLQPVAEDYWDVSETPSVFFVLAGSAAAKAGVKAGDVGVSPAINGAKPICDYPVQIRYTDEINAFATGENIIVTSAMAGSIKDDTSLALILAHELAHNILGHVEEGASTKLEREADRTGLFLLARAGYDYEKAIRGRSAVRAVVTGREILSEGEKGRGAYFRTVAAEIKALQEAGEPLIP